MPHPKSRAQKRKARVYIEQEGEQSREAMASGEAECGKGDKLCRLANNNNNNNHNHNHNHNHNNDL